MIRTYVPGDAGAIFEIWNSVGLSMGYAPLTMEKLGSLFLKHPDFSPKHTFLLEEQGELLGFVSGCTGEHIPKGTERGYFTALMLRPQADTRENTAALLSALEDSFREAGRSVCAVTFFNPVRLPWILPGTPGHQHNNLPGIPTDLNLYDRMISLGYREAAREQAMYLSLEDFSVPQAIEERARRMAREGYTVARYDSQRHRGLREMVDALGNPMWSAEIPAAGESGLNLLVGLSGDTCAGFTGPIYPEETGRGYFAGIGVAPQYERHGLGKLLFYRLLQQEKLAGAEYMSLFTGEDNPARHIYEEAGFRVVRRFSVMLKEL